MYLALAWLFILLRQGTNGGQGANLSYWVDKSIFRAFFVFKDEKNYVFYFLHKTLHFNFVVIFWFLKIGDHIDNWLTITLPSVKLCQPFHILNFSFYGLAFWSSKHLNVKSKKASLLVKLGIQQHEKYH